MPGRREQKEARGYTLLEGKAQRVTMRTIQQAGLPRNGKRNVSGADLDRIRNARLGKSRGCGSEERKERVAVP
jgi:hypothetical protein